MALSRLFVLLLVVVSRPYLKPWALPIRKLATTTTTTRITARDDADGQRRIMRMRQRLFEAPPSDQDTEKTPKKNVVALENGIDTNLLPPLINIRKESILFGDNPATKQNNNTLKAWRATKKNLPFVFTGARTASTADDNPIGGFYNMIFVRLPTILAGLVYSKNVVSGHPLVVDLGSGPTELSPLVVASVLFLILR